MTTLSQKLRTEYAGFTLIELLVVIGVITILLAISVPLLGRARARATKQVCASQLKQIEVALLMLKEDSDGKWPEATVGEPSRQPNPVYIADVLDRYVGGQRRVFRCPQDKPGAFERDAPHTNKSWFETEKSSYEWLVFGMSEFAPFHWGETRLRTN